MFKHTSAELLIDHLIRAANPKRPEISITPPLPPLVEGTGLCVYESLIALFVIVCFLPDHIRIVPWHGGVQHLEGGNLRAIDCVLCHHHL